MPVSLMKWPFTWRHNITTLNAKVNNWWIELSNHNIKFKFIWGVKKKLADTLSGLIDLELADLNLPEKEGYEYGYIIFKQVPDIYVDSCKHKPVPHVNVPNVNAMVVKEERGEDKEIVTQYKGTNRCTVQWPVLFYYAKANKWQEDVFRHLVTEDDTTITCCGSTKYFE